MDNTVQRPGKPSLGSDYEHNASWEGISSLVWGPARSMSQLCSHSRVSHSCQVCATLQPALWVHVSWREQQALRGRHRLPSSHSQKHLLEKKKTHKKQKTRKAKSDKCHPRRYKSDKCHPRRYKTFYTLELLSPQVPPQDIQDILHLELLSLQGPLKTMAEEAQT